MSDSEKNIPSDAGELLSGVYQRLRRLAVARMSNESAGNTLQATALVHEVWLKLGDDLEAGRFNDESHFVAVAATAMRRVLVDHARHKKTSKRGAGMRRTTLNHVAELEAGATENDQLILVDEALERLTAEYPRQAELVNLRFFAGLTTAEAAAALSISIPTADRDWKFAKAWLFRELEPPSPE